jgi:hypothetical protein
MYPAVSEAAANKSVLAALPAYHLIRIEASAPTDPEAW